MKLRGKVILASTLAAAGTFAAVAASRSVNHNVPLGPAIDAERRSIRTRTGGLANYYIDPTGSGFPVILVHGVHAAASAFDMKPMFETWRGKRPVIAVDLPGFGFSDRADRPYTTEFYVEFLAEFLETVIEPYGQADVVGLSLSCEFLGKAALTIPSLIRSLTFISPTGFSARKGVPAGERAKAQSRSEFAFRVLSSPLIGRPLFDAIVSRPSIRYFLGQAFAGPIDEAYASYTYATSHQPGACHAPLAFVSGLLFDPNIRANAYELLPMPVAVLYDEDPHVSFDELEATLSRHPSWFPVRIAPTRGLPHFEKPVETKKAMEEFFAKLDIGELGQPTAPSLPN